MALLMDAPQVLLAHPSVPARTLAELVAYAKAHPGELNYASSGNGSMQHLGTELLKQRAGIELEHVPYKGTGPVMQDLIAGRVQLFLTTPPPAIPFLQNGQLRALALAARERHPALPEVPTAAEAGLRDFTVTSWQAVMGPAGMAPPLLARVHAAVVEALRHPETVQRLGQIGLTVVADGPESYGAFQRAEIERWRGVVRAAGIKAE